MGSGQEQDRQGFGGKVYTVLELEYDVEVLLSHSTRSPVAPSRKQRHAAMA